MSYLPEPDGADVHPDMLGEPVEVDFETGAVRVLEGAEAQAALEHEEASARALALAPDEEGA